MNRHASQCGTHIAVIPGGTATYTIIVTNSGPSNATNTTVSDFLLSGVTLTANVTGVPAGVATCGTVTGTTGQTTFGATGATIGAGAGNSITLTAPLAFASSLTAEPLVNAVSATGSRKRTDIRARS